MASISNTAWSLWRLKWGAIRLAIAATLVGVWLEDAPMRLARLQLASLPNMDYIKEAKRLQTTGRFADALLVLDAAKEVSAEDDAALDATRNEIKAERDSLIRRAKEFARGVLIGTGSSFEALGGAVGADFFIVGDIRDLFLESAKLALDGEADELILALSAVGVLSTFQPHDCVLAFLKVVQKAGGLSKNMAKKIRRLCNLVLKGGNPAELLRVAENVEAITKQGSLATAARVLRHVDDVTELETIARFARRHPHGGFALLVTGEDGVKLLTRSLGKSEDAVRLAARKGNYGVAWLRTQNFRLLRPHPLIGLLKTWRKGHLDGLTQRIFDWLDPRGWIVVAVLATWIFTEASLVWRKLVAIRKTIGSETATNPHFGVSDRY